VIVLLTDGINNRGITTPENAARAARARGIRIHAVGVGASGPVRVPVLDERGNPREILQDAGLDEASLREIADITGGRYFRAADFTALEEVYFEIDRMEKSRIDAKSYTRYEERFAPFALLGLLFLALEKVAGLSRLGKLP
jgi:Ca-activated chloride channel family protein